MSEAMHLEKTRDKEGDKEIVVVGKPEFTLGFRLAGIKKVFSTADPALEVKNLLSGKEVGIVIMDEDSTKSLSSLLREQMLKSIAPVFITVSAHAAQEELRKMVLQSVGVDLLKE